MFEKSQKMAILSKMQIKNTNMRRIKNALKWPSQIVPKVHLLPNKYFLYFSQIKHFQNFQKIQCVVELCLDIWLDKFQGDISIFGKHVVEKPCP